MITLVHTVSLWPTTPWMAWRRLGGSIGPLTVVNGRDPRGADKKAWQNLIII